MSSKCQWALSLKLTYLYKYSTYTGLTSLIRRKWNCIYMSIFDHHDCNQHSPYAMYDIMYMHMLYHWVLHDILHTALYAYAMRKMQCARCNAQDAKCKMQDVYARCNAQCARCKMHTYLCNMLNRNRIESNWIESNPESNVPQSHACMHACNSAAVL